MRSMWFLRRLPRVVSLPLCFAVGLLCVGLCGAALAQTPAPKTGAGAAKEASPPGAETAWERLIYLPFKNLSAVFEKEGADGGTVFMPYAQFRKLWDAAQAEAQRNPAQPPVAAVITKAAYVGRIENNLARIDATYTIQSLDRPWAEIPLRFGDAAVGKMTSPDERVLLRGTGDGTYALLLPLKGEYTVQLELVSRVRSSTEGRSFELETPAVGITTLELTVPAADQTVEVTPHLVSTPVAGDDKSTKIQASLGATGKLAARWYPRVSKTPEMELLASVTNVQSVRVADGLVHADATLTYHVLRGQLDQVRIAVPLGHRLLDVAAPGLKGWKAVNEANRQVITVDLLSEAAKDLPVEIRTERAAGAEPFDLGGIDEDGTVRGIHALGAVRESGILVAGHSPDLALTVGEQQGVIRIEASEVPEALRRADNLYYKYYSSKFRLQASVKPVEPRIVVEHRTALEFHDDELQLHANLVYQIERAGIFELRWKVPAGLKIDRVDCEQKKDFSVSPDGGTLVLTLNEKTQGGIQVAIRGRRELKKGEAEMQFKLPLLEPLDVTREQGSVQVYAPEALEVVTDEKGLVGVQPDRTEAQSQRQQMRLASSWTYNRRPVEIPVTTVRKPTRLTADVATTINVKQELIEIVSLLEFNVLYAGVDTFRFAVPAAVAANVQIDTVAETGGPSIKQRSRSEPGPDGWVVWTVVLQREVTGPQQLRVKYDLKPEQKENSATLLVQPLRALGVPGDEANGERVPLSRVGGEIVVQKDRALSISAAPKDLEAIDVRELSRLPQEGYLAYRYFKQPVELELTATKHEIQEVVQTVVSRALIEAVITQDDFFTYRCRYRLKTSERQRLIIDLPAQIEPLGVVVAGKQVSLEKNQPGRGDYESYFINVARTTRSDEPFSLTLLFRTRSRPLPTKSLGGRLALPIPRFGGAEAAQKAGVAIQQLRVAVWIPEEYTLVGAPPKFTLDRQPTLLRPVTIGISGPGVTEELNQWIGDTGGSLFEFPTAGHAFTYSNLGGADKFDTSWWRSTWVAWVMSGALFLIGFVLARTSWENKLGMLLVAGFAAALVALADADLVLHILAACRFGLIAMLAYWLIHALLHRRPVRGAAGSPPLWPIVEHVPAVIPPPGIFDHLRPTPPRPDAAS